MAFTRVLAVVCLFLVLASPPVAAGSCVVYTVKTGDTLWKISKTYKTTVERLVQANKIKDPDMILVGQKLKICK
jgi:LysM repeat protein